MMSYKSVLKFMLIFVITFAVLLIPSFGFRSLYRNIFIASGMAMFQNFGEKGIVLLEPQKKDVSALKVYIANKETKVNGVYGGTHYDFNIYSTGLFIPVVFFISLVAAISISWKRKTVALLSGFLLILLYAMLKLRIVIMFYYSLNPWTGLYQGTQEKESISFWYHYVALQNTPEFTFALFLWILLCIGKREWQYLNGAFEEVVVKKKVKTSR